MDICLRRHHALVGDIAFSHKIDSNLEGHLNYITGSKVTAILLNGGVLPIGGVSSVECLLSRGPTPSSF